MLNFRQYNLILNLASSSKYLPAKYYAEILDVSEKTIYNDIDKVNDYLNGFDMKIDKIPRKGILLISKKDEKERIVEIVLKKLAEQNLNYHLKIRLIKDFFLKKESNHNSLEKLAQEYYVSYSSLYNQWCELIVDLDYFNISLENGYKIIGDEHNVQRWITQSLRKELSMYNLTDNNVKNVFTQNIFDDLTLKVVNSLLMELESTNKDFYYTDYYDSLALSFLVFIQRRLTGHSMNSDIQEIITLPMLTTYQLALTIGDNIYDSTKLILNKYDIEYISFLLFTHKMLPYYESNIQNDTITNLTNSLIENIESMSGLKFNDTELYESLRNHIGPMIYRLKAGIFVENPLKEEIKESYPVLFSLIRLASSDLEKKYNIVISDDEMAFLTIYFQTAFEKKVEKQKIAIVCPQGYTTSNLIYNKIHSMLPANYELKMMNFSLANKLTKEEVEFIISPVDYEHKYLEVIKINPVMTMLDLNKIIQRIAKSNSITVDSSVEDSAEISLKNFRDKISILQFKEELTKLDLLYYINDFLLEQNYVQPKFIKTVEKRELIGSTILSTHVAIPHGDSQKVNETNIVVCKMEKGIKWNDKEKVNLVVMPNISQEDFPIAKSIMQSLFDVILNEDKVLKILSTNNKELIKEILIQEDEK